MSQETRRIAVLTGDLVKSTDLGPDRIDQAFAALRQSAEVQRAWHGETLNFTRHRGDGWQVALARPELALRSALAFRAALRAEGDIFDSYIGIAAGEITAPLGPDLNTESAPVFMSSGRVLEIAKSSGKCRILFGYGDTPGVEAAAYLASHISDGWTPTQAASILPFLAPGAHPSVTDVAKSMGKSRQAVAKSIDSAALLPLDMALTRIEGTPDD